MLNALAIFFELNILIVRLLYRERCSKHNLLKEIKQKKNRRKDTTHTLVILASVSSYINKKLH